MKFYDHKRLFISPCFAPKVQEITPFFASMLGLQLFHLRRFRFWNSLRSYSQIVHFICLNPGELLEKLQLNL